MDRSERFYRIEQLLHDRRIATFEEIQSVLEVSRATLKRDFQYLRDRLNAPIVYDRETGGYRFESPSGGPAFQLPGLWFNASEIHALLTMQHLLANLDTGGLLGPHIGQCPGRSRTAHPHRPCRQTPCRPRVLRTDRHGPAQASPSVHPPLEPRPQRRDRARGLAAAAGVLSRQLVSRRLVPPARRDPQFRRRRHSPRRTSRTQGKGGRGKASRRGAWCRLWHFLGRGRDLGKAALYAGARALGCVRTVASATKNLDRRGRLSSPRNSLLEPDRTDHGHSAPRRWRGSRGAEHAAGSGV